MNQNLGRRTMQGLALLPLLLAGCGDFPSTPLQDADAGPDGYQVAAIRSFSKHKGDYLPAHNFKLEIDGVIAGSFRTLTGLPRLDLRQGGFKEVSGLESEVEIIEYRNGDDPLTHKRAGKAKYRNITLRHGRFDPLMLDWSARVLAGSTDRKSGSVIFMDRAGSEVMRYNFFEAWPVRYKLDLRDERSVELLELAVERLEPVAKALPGDPIPGVDVR